MPSDRLDKYREKRAAGSTPEPFGGTRASSGPRLFVVQMHDARNLHWDLRLEMDGALESWAVPKGPSPNPADKRLAMHVEPHPLEYADFEGVIPDGQYGAGPSICWDRGVWIEIPSKPGGPPHGLEHGKLLFELRGYKLKGLWTLVHTPRNGDNHWLLIKERDALVDEGGTDIYPRDSILSGLTVEELPDPDEKLARLRDEAEEAGARPRPRDGAAPPLMLATAHDEPFTRDGWLFEIKYDGYRIAAERTGGGATLWSRNGNDLTGTFPEIAQAVRALPYPGLVLDGEVVVHDAQGMPSFSLLQKRGRLTKRPDVAAAAVQLPATYYAFDLLDFGGLDLRGVPLVDRKRILRELLPTVGPIRYSEHIEREGEAVFRHAAGLGIEGVVAKKADAPYTRGRSENWLKIRTVRSDEFVVVGWTDPKGSRSGFGALHLARYTSPPNDDPSAELVYVGSVGTGFDQAALDAIEGALAEAPRDDPPCGGEIPTGAGHHWVEPRMVAEVRYKELTLAGHLRHPVFVTLRDDKDPTECVVPAGADADADPRAAAPEGDAEDLLPEPGPVVGGVERTVALTNQDKVLYPAHDGAEGVTKGEVIAYYEAVADWILPYLKDRCLVLTRYPDGIDKSSFYQKNAPDWAPDWIRTETVYSEGSERDLSYFVIDDVAGLRYVANSAALLLHLWGSRVTDLGHPDWCILDLDPKDAPFTDVVELALALKAICDDIGLPVFVKTSGSSGLHLMVPLGGRLTHDQCKQLAQLLATVAVKERGDIATIDRVIERRDGKVYVDFLQNGWGKLLVAPFSTRPVPEAAVSMPLEWREVTPDLGPRDFTVRNAIARLEKLGEDPLRPVLELRPDLLGALERLLGRVG
ncbi:DNA ligase D [Gaopeijia maritima]|uniref:DNA ligase D n=1 Tax=Gaopeijia maritima TaxID=3119007 RepID=UPI003248D3EE